MWSHAAQGGGAPPPPPPPGGSAGPPPPANYYSQQQQQYSQPSHSHDDEQDDYPNYDNDSGALSSTINLVTSGVSALFARGGQQPPPPPVVTQQQTSPLNAGVSPPPINPETSMLSSHAGHGAPPVRGPPRPVGQPSFMMSSASNVGATAAAGPPPIYPATAGPPSTTAAPPVSRPNMPAASPRGPPTVVRSSSGGSATTATNNPFVAAAAPPPASPRVAAMPPPASPKVTPSTTTTTTAAMSPSTTTTAAANRPSSASRLSKLPRPVSHLSPNRGRVHLLNLPSPKSSPRVLHNRRAFGGFKMPPPMNKDDKKSAKKTADSTAPSIPVLDEPSRVPQNVPTTPDSIPHPPTSGLMPPTSPAPPAARMLPATNATASHVIVEQPEMEVPTLSSDFKQAATEVLKRETEEVHVTENLAAEQTEEAVEESKQGDELLPGWTEYTDPSTNRPYYVHVSGETTWERPTTADTQGGTEGEQDETEAPVATKGQVETDQPTVELKDPDAVSLTEPTIASDTGLEDLQAFPEELPEGWQELIDEASGRPYYYHAQQDVATWDRPSVVAAPLEAEPESTEPDSSIAQLEAETTASPESTAPAELAEDPSSAQDEMIEPTPEEEQEEEALLPGGWVQEIDEGSGMPYYYHVDDRIGTSTWQRPSVSVAESEESPSVDDNEEFSEFAAKEAEEPTQEPEPAHEAEMTALPDGWVEYTDPSSGTPYYVNTSDNTTSWDRPVMPSDAAAEQPALGTAGGVSEVAEEASGGIEEDTGEPLASDISPELHSDEIRRADVEPTEETPQETQQETEPERSDQVANAALPDGWQELFDESSGLPYYFHAASDTATWERPGQAEEETAEEPPAEAAGQSLGGECDEGTQPEDTGGSFVEQAPSEEAPEQTPSHGVERDGDWNLVSPDVDDASPSPVVQAPGDDASPELQVEASAEEAAYENESVPVESQIPSGDRELPPNWVELYDPSGNAYYYNEVTRESTWDRPTAAPATTTVAPTTDLDEAPLESLATDEIEGTQEEVEPESLLAEACSPKEEEETDEHGQPELAALPPGWKELLDPATGNTYYLNESLGTSTWDRPAPVVSEEEPVAPPVKEEVQEQESEPKLEEPVEDTTIEPEEEKVTAVEELPPGWVEMIDPASGDTYYLNEAEDISTWERPIASAEPPAVPNGAESMPLEEHAGEPVEEEPVAGDADDSGELVQAGGDEQPLPEGWKQYFDEASGQPYYLNEADGETSWERPKSEPKAKDAPVLEKAPESQGGSSLGFEMIDHDDAVSEPHTDEMPQEPATDAEPEVFESGLPSGWTEHLDPTSGKPYYYNAETQTTSWDKPKVDETPDFPKTKPSKSSDRSRPPHAIAMFGFGGKLCVWRPKSSSTVTVYRTGELLPSEPISIVEKEKSGCGVSGPLNVCRSGTVLEYLELKAALNSAEAPTKSLLWNLICIAANSSGRLRSDEGMRDPESPEAAVTKLLLSENVPSDESTEPREGVVIDALSLRGVEDLLLRGQREQAVEEALSSKNFAMAVLVASMCDRNTFQRATRKYAEEVLASGSPLHTLAMLFSGQLQPPKDSALDRTGIKESVWDEHIDDVSSAWKRHLAAIVSNRTLGWDRIVLSLGDSLLELGNVHAAHFCYMVCGCPVTSILHPSTRIAIVGCDHLVPMDAALMTKEGVMSYARTEAYEWAKRRGNQNAAIPSLQPFKLMYAMLLADMGHEDAAKLYVQSIRECSGLDSDESSRQAPAATIWALAQHEAFASALSEFEDRLLRRGPLSADSKVGPANASRALKSGAGMASGSSNADSNMAPQFVTAATPQRGSGAAKMPSLAEPSPSKPLAQFVPSQVAPEDDPNASFLSAQSNLLDVTTSSTVDRSVGPGTSQNRRVKAIRARNNVVKPSQSDVPAAVPPTVETTMATGFPPTTMITPPVAGTAAATDSQSPKQNQHAPSSAPAQLVSDKHSKPKASPKKKAPSSDKKPAHAPWSLGIKDKMTKWLNPDATTADLGEGMQAYYDEDRKCWIFPGEDPEEKAKPIGPPPTSLGPSKQAEPQKEEAMKDDPLAAMMAPPKRAAPNALLRTTSAPSRPAGGMMPHGMPPVGTSAAGAPSIPGIMPPGMLPAGTSASAPKFAVFMPAPVQNSSSSADEKNSNEE